MGTIKKQTAGNDKVVIDETMDATDIDVMETVLFTTIVKERVTKSPLKDTMDAMLWIATLGGHNMRTTVDYNIVRRQVVNCVLKN